MDKHTPGPWIVEKTKTKLWIGTPKATEKVDDIVVGLEFGDEYKTSFLIKQESNARLIAAAPEMYELIKDIKEMNVFYDEAIERLSYIIQKITPNG